MIIKVFSPPPMLHNYLHCLCMAKNKMLRSKAACDRPLVVAAEVFTALSLLLEFPVTSVALNSNSGEHCWSSQPLPLSSPLLSSPGETNTPVSSSAGCTTAGGKGKSGAVLVYETEAWVPCDFCVQSSRLAMGAAQKVNHILGCTKSTLSSRPKDRIHPLYSPHETPHGVLHPALRLPA